MAEQKKTPCSWCSGSSSLNMGVGMFRDTDYDLSPYTYDGIPICGGCGGTGFTLENKDFKARVKRIMNLRSQYCPMDGLPEPSDAYRVNILNKLVVEVAELTQFYGIITGSYAEKIVHGRLTPLLNGLKSNQEELLEMIRNYDPSDPDVEASREAMLAYYGGDFLKGHSLFETVMAKNPGSGKLWHDFGAMVLINERDKEKALPLFARAVEATPVALHIFHLAQCFHYLKKDSEAKKTLEGINLTPGYGNIRQEIHELEQELVK